MRQRWKIDQGGCCLFKVRSQLWVREGTHPHLLTSSVQLWLCCFFFLPFFGFSESESWSSVSWRVNHCLSVSLVNSGATLMPSHCIIFSSICFWPNGYRNQPPTTFLLRLLNICWTILCLSASSNMTKSPAGVNLHLPSSLPQQHFIFSIHLYSHHTTARQKAIYGLMPLRQSLTDT